jgi:hypothetical protein
MIAGFRQPAKDRDVIRKRKLLFFRIFPAKRREQVFGVNLRSAFSRGDLDDVVRGGFLLPG